MTKNKDLTYEEATEIANQKKEELRTAKGEFKEFRKENKLKADTEPEDPKLAKQYGKLSKAVEAAEEAYNTAAEEAKKLKPAVTRASQYEYPEGMTAQEKKRFRAKARAAARKAAKGEEAPAKEAKDEEASAEGAEGKADKKKKKREEVED